MDNPIVRLLLVDDIDANLLALEQLVEAPDRQLIRASSGEEALEILLKEQDFAVILMDVQMPGLDGFETVQLLKAKEQCENIPIIFLTAYDKEGAMAIDAYSSGAVDYVTKPIHPNILISKVDVFVDLYRSHKRLILKNNRLEEANIRLTREISLRERAEAQLRLADQAIHDTHEGVVITDGQGIIQRVNPAFCHLSGYPLDELVERNFLDILKDEKNAEIGTLLFENMRHEGEWQGELIGKTKNAHPFSTWTHISGIYNKQRQLTHYCAILSAVNDPQKTEIALRKVKLRLEQAQHISHLGGWEWNHTDSDIYCSEELYHILDRNPDQVAPTLELCREVIHPDDHDKLDIIISDLEKGRPTDSILRLALPDGRERTIHEQTEVRRNKDGAIVQLIGTIHDITEHAKLEASFMQAQKMEAIGAMVGGIAHEFNNVLAGMNGHLYLAGRFAGEQNKVQDHLAHMKALSIRAAETIEKMLAFSRKGIIQMHAVNLNKLIQETLMLHKTSIPEHIDLAYELCTKDVLVQGDSTLLQQMLLNLLINARDALGAADSPAIKVCLRRFEPDEVFLQKYPDAFAGEFAQLSIRDNGSGIAKEMLDKIFEPFFTSKGESGTGLGLSMVYGAVQSHHGFVDVTSSPENGTAFHVHLPLLSDQTETEVLEHHSEPVEGNGETILFADDEAVLRDTVSDSLGEIGYHVIVAENGQQAVDLYASREHAVDLTILDVVMPKMGGIEAAQAIRAINADAAIVFSTGYDRDSSLRKESAANETIITKPFSIEKFSKLIRTALKNRK
ncbi:MAG: response regulator [Mariprofundaceae bacterium]